MSTDNTNQPEVAEAFREQWDEAIKFQLNNEKSADETNLENDNISVVVQGDVDNNYSKMKDEHIQGEEYLFSHSIFGEKSRTSSFIRSSWNAPAQIPQPSTSAAAYKATGITRLRLITPKPRGAEGEEQEIQEEPICCQRMLDIQRIEDELEKATRNMMGIINTYEPKTTDQDDDTEAEIEQDDKKTPAPNDASAVESTLDKGKRMGFFRRVFGAVFNRF